MPVVTKNKKTGYWSDPKIKAKSFGEALSQGNWLIRYRYASSERMTPAVSLSSALVIARGVLKDGHQVTIIPMVTNTDPFGVQSWTSQDGRETITITDNKE